MVGLGPSRLLVTGLQFESLAALVTTLACSFARTGSLLPDATVAISLVVVGAAVSLTLTASLVSACIAPCATALEPVAA